MQKIWRNLNKIGHSGYSLWSVNEVVGTTEQIVRSVQNWPNLYTQCRDGSYVTIDYHLFETKERAASSVHDQWDDQQLICIACWI